MASYTKVIWTLSNHICWHFPFTGLTSCSSLPTVFLQDSWVSGLTPSSAPSHLIPDLKGPASPATHHISLLENLIITSAHSTQTAKLIAACSSYWISHPEAVPMCLHSLQLQQPTLCQLGYFSLCVAPTVNPSESPEDAAFRTLLEFVHFALFSCCLFIPLPELVKMTLTWILPSISPVHPACHLQIELLHPYNHSVSPHPRQALKCPWFHSRCSLKYL